MPDHDQLFKQLISTFFVEFLELFFPEILEYLDRKSIEFLDKEMFTDPVSGRKYQADLVVKARFRDSGAFFIIHNENQARREEDFDQRMFFYFSATYQKYRLPVYPIAVLSFDSPKKEQPHRHSIAFPDLEVLKFTYRVVQLNRLDWHDFLNRPNPVAAALMSKMRVAKADRPRVKLECLRMLVSLNLNLDERKLVSGFVDTYLELDDDETKVFERELSTFDRKMGTDVMEIVTSWMKTGIQQGEMKERNLVLRQLTRKIGKLTATEQKRFESLSIEQVEALGEALLDFASKADLKAWLAALKR